MLVFGWQVGLLAAFVHVNLYLGGSAAVNAIGHHFGRRPYDNAAGNLQWLAFITAGEGLHNNHHAAPTSAKLAHRWFEIDPGWYVIKVADVAAPGQGPPQRAAPHRRRQGEVQGDRPGRLTGADRSSRSPGDGPDRTRQRRSGQPSALVSSSQLMSLSRNAST